MYLLLSREEKLKLQGLSARLKGVKYDFGAEVAPDTSITEILEKQQKIDCSELVELLFNKIGYKVPDGSYNQYRASAPVFENHLEVGDLVFKQKGGAINHVGVIISVNPTLTLEAEGWYGEVIARPFMEFKNVKSAKASQYAGARRFLKELISDVDADT
jgi:hypothetical protein